jgi:putative copper resistance protein D
VLRFSRLALPTVALLAVAGGYLALRTLPSVSALFTSNYGLTLMLKSVVAFDALAIGGYHHRLLIPKIAAGAPVASMRRTLALELGLLLIALVLAASLSQTAPPS